MRWRSAVVSFDGLGAIVSVAGAHRLRGAVGCEAARGRRLVVPEEKEKQGRSSQFVKLDEADFPCPPPNNPNVWSNR